jgi:hypothetical protein
LIPSRIVGTFVLAVAVAAAPAYAVDDPAVDPDVEDEDPLSRHRTRFDVLADRTIGTTSVPVQFNWRDTTAQVAVTGSYLVELNNFNSMRGGALVRLPSGGVLFEVGVAYASSWDSPSSRLLELTPYRQPGRPNRLDVDFAVGLPLAEGVVTTFPKFFPAVQLVFNAWGGLRYHVYPSGFAGMRTGQVAGALFAPALTEIELENLEDNRLDSMQVDAGRYGLLLGLGNDIYFGSGFFLSPRVMVAVPLLAPASATELYVWSDLSLSLGLAL